MTDRDGRLGRTANDDFHEALPGWMAVGLILAVALHFSLFILLPEFHAADIRGTLREMEGIELPPPVKVPPPPEQIRRPATPRVGSVELDEDITIERTTFEANPPSELGPPPETGVPAPSERPHFIPYETPPRLLNGPEVEKTLERVYPQPLREGGVGGRVMLWIYVTAEGVVENTVVKEGSGFTALDQAAATVARAMRFSPAKNRDKATAVWVSQAITFRVK